MDITPQCLLEGLCDEVEDSGKNSVEPLMITLLCQVKIQQSWEIKDHVVLRDIETPGRLLRKIWQRRLYLQVIYARNFDRIGSTASDFKK